MVYTKTAMRLFGGLADGALQYFPNIKTDLKKAKMKAAAQEYLSSAILTMLVIFLFELPLLSLIFAIIFQSFLFAFITSFTVSIFLSAVFFFAFVNYPKLTIKDRAKKIDNNLAFSSLYLSTIVGSKLPLHKVFEIFGKFSKYDEITDEVAGITRDIEGFGLDINTALERAIQRTPSKEFKELLWGVLSVNRSGGDVDRFLKEKSKNYLNEYRRKLYEFSHQLTMFIEIYLTVVIIGAIFFTILTSIMSGIAGSTGDIMFIQFFLIFIFLPLTSVAFIIFVKSISPAGE